MKHDYLIGIMMKHDYLNYWSIIDETLLMKHDYLIGIMMKHDCLNYWSIIDETLLMKHDYLIGIMMKTWLPQIIDQLLMKHYWWNMITS